jgi:ABC-2 type transport system ATP-binding protein
MAVIVIKNVEKRYKIFQDKSHHLKEKILFRYRNQYEYRPVLKDMNLSVQKGEAVALIGRNGCGKSTLLKLLTKILYPDSGKIEVSGRVSSLIELGAGFHPDMTGKENIYINASIFGLSKSEIDVCIERIIEFSELGEFIDSPVRIYSSGMYMRLAFSVAIHVNADILLIDEILAVGDAHFQKKCFDKLIALKKEGMTIIIVSHALEVIESFCDRSVWIENGCVQMMGYPQDVHRVYLNAMENQNCGQRQDPNDLIQEINDKRKESPVSVKEVLIIDSDYNHYDQLETTQRAIIRIAVQVNTPVGDLYAGIAFYREDGLLCYRGDTRSDRFMINDLQPGEYAICFDVFAMLLLPSVYFLDVFIGTQEMGEIEYKEKVKRFSVISAAEEGGVFRMQHHWSLY